MDNQAQTENTTTSVTIAPGTGVNVPEGAKTESQPRPVDKEKVKSIQKDKEQSVKDGKIITK